MFTSITKLKILLQADRKKTKAKLASVLNRFYPGMTFEELNKKMLSNDDSDLAQAEEIAREVVEKP